MADETEGSFRRGVLGLQLRALLTFIVAFVVGFAIGAVLWAIVSGRDVVAIVGDVLTLLTLVAALVALKYAAESARAALATVKPMTDMAADLAATAATTKANLKLAESGRQEDRLTRRLEQYERIHAGLVRIQVAKYENEMREGQVALRTALAPFPAEKLPACWKVATIKEGFSAVEGLASDGLTEIDPPLSNLSKQLDDLLESAGAKPQPDGAANANPG